MKKAIILILGGAASLALSLVLGINAQSRAESVNELFETNLEALADVEHKGTCKHPGKKAFRGDGYRNGRKGYNNGCLS